MISIQRFDLGIEKYLAMVTVETLISLNTGWQTSPMEVTLITQFPSYHLVFRAFTLQLNPKSMFQDYSESEGLVKSSSGGKFCLEVVLVENSSA